MSSLFIGLSPYFAGLKGHDYIYHEALQKAAEALGWKGVSLIPKSEPSLGPTWIGHFRTPKNPVAFFILRTIDYWRVARVGKPILFAETYQVRDLFPLLIALFFLKGHFWQVVRDGMERRWLKQRLHIWFAKVVRWKLGKRYQLLFDSQVAANTFAPLVGFPVTVLPIPHTCNETPAGERIEKRGIALCLPGTARREKGVDEIVRFCSKEDAGLKKLELWIENVDGLKAISSKIHCRWTPGGLPREEYLRILSSADAILLPYEPLSYISRTSGPFVEAICLGKMVFARAGGWIAHELSQYDLRECILDWDDPKAPSRLIEVLQDRGVQAKLKKMQEAYCRFHNLESFTNALRILKGVES